MNQLKVMEICTIKYTNVKDSKEEIIEVDKVLVSVGRKPIPRV